MSVFNAAGILGSELGAALTAAAGVTDHNFENLAPLIAGCTLTSLLPVPFIGLIRDAERHQGSPPGVSSSDGSSGKGG
jgi:hypothetical protein